MTASFSPTAEQQIAIDMFATGKSLAIEAGAGAGKTSTLRLLAESTNRRGQYIAFNSAIVKESKTKMPGTVQCSTAHSLAWRNIIPGTRYADRLKNSARMKSTEIAKRLGVEQIRVTLQDGTQKRLAASYLAGVVMNGVIKFCQSADLEPEAKHVPYLDGIDLPPGARHNNAIVARALVPAMRKAWKDITDEQGSLPFKHDHYLKMWHLSGPRINAAYIMFDEAQDANPVLVDIVKQQTHAQLVWVGDSQQQIYSFTGAVNALQQVGAEQEAYLSQSFRFGPAIADVANICLRGLDAKLTLRGTETIPSRVGSADDSKLVTILCRTNATAVRELLNALKQERSANLVGGGREVIDFAKAARNLMADGWTSHAELACFSSWGEVQTYVEQDEQGGDLRLLVDLIDEFGVDTIIEALENMTPEAQAEIVISTAHKSKGREWDTVQLADDFKADPTGEELRLLYVAVTRAKTLLDVTAIRWLNGGFAPVVALGPPTMGDHEDEARRAAAYPAASAFVDYSAAAARKPLGALLAEERAAAPATTGTATAAREGRAEAAREATERTPQRTVAEHLAGAEGEYRIMGWGEQGAQTLGTFTDSRKAIETASALWSGGSFSRVSVVDQGNGELVVEYDA